MRTMAHHQQRTVAHPYVVHDPAIVQRLSVRPLWRDDGILCIARREKTNNNGDDDDDGGDGDDNVKRSHTEGRYSVHLLK